MPDATEAQPQPGPQELDKTELESAAEQLHDRFLAEGHDQAAYDAQYGWLDRRVRQVKTLRDYTTGIETGESTTVLREHQTDVFEDLVGFLERGGDTGYIKLPTGTGKTAIFVELCRALRDGQEKPEDKPKILVLVPTKDLVLQTIGDERERGGFQRFAPHIRTLPYYGDISVPRRLQNLAEADVVVSTYDSLITMMDMRDKYRSWTEDDWDAHNQQLVDRRTELQQDEANQTNMIMGYLATHKMARLVGSEEHDVVRRMRSEKAAIRRDIKQVNRRMEIAKRQQAALDEMESIEYIICDEAHRSIGDRTKRSIDRFAENGKRVMIGLTATDEYLERHLQDEFGELIHDMDLVEAINLKLLNSVAMYRHKTGIHYQNVKLNSIGDFDEELFGEMLIDSSRNGIIIDYVKTFVEAGLSGVVTAIPGNKAQHAKILSSMLRKTTAIDPKTGKERYIRAAAITGETKPRDRARLLKDFEEGRIDFMTFVDVLREGWDSDRAKVLINSRPTRSPLLATQRLGRVLRYSETSNISYIVDLYDSYFGVFDEEEIPPLPAVTAVDVLGLGRVEQGTIIGEGAAPQDAPLRHKLGAMVVGDDIDPAFTRHMENLKNTPVLTSNKSITTIEGGTLESWMTADRMKEAFSGFMPRKLLELYAQPDAAQQIRTRDARTRTATRMVYKYSDVQQLDIDAPLINPEKLYVDDADTKWISPEGAVKLVAKIVTAIDPEDIRDLVAEYERTEQLPLQFAKVRINYEAKRERFGYTELYRLDDIVDKIVPLIRDAYGR